MKPAELQKPPQSFAEAHQRAMHPRYRLLAWFLTATGLRASAVVSTGTFGWRVYEWRHARGHHVEVVLSMGVVSLPGGVVSAILLNVYNRGDSAVNVTSAGLEVQDGSGNTIQNLPRPGANVPGRVGPRDSGMTWFDFEEVRRNAGVDPTRPLRGFVHLATGDKVWSKPKALMSA